MCLYYKIMDIIDDCCAARERALNLMTKWCYLDPDGVRHGPFTSFMILYYIYSFYFEEDTLFSKFDTTSPSYNSLINFLDAIVDDVKIHGQGAFSCIHLMEKLTDTNHSDVNISPILDVSFKEITNTDTEIPQSPQVSSNITKLVSSPQFDQHSLPIQPKQPEFQLTAQRLILKKRLESSFKEAEAHLSRINTRKISHVIEKTLNHGTCNDNKASKN